MYKEAIFGAHFPASQFNQAAFILHHGSLERRGDRELGVFAEQKDGGYKPFGSERVIHRLDSVVRKKRDICLFLEEKYF